MPEIKYSKAVKRLDEIIEKIETEQIDVDELVDGSLHRFSEELQEAIAGFHTVIEATWFSPSHATVGG